MAAQEVTFVVDPDAGAGYDYESLVDFEAFEATQLITNNLQYSVYCRCTGGTADVFGGYFSNLTWTSDASNHFIKIWTDPAEGYRHNGTYQTGNKYRLEVTNGFWENEEQHMRWIGIQFKSIATAAGNRGLRAIGGTTIVDQCVFVGVLSALAGGAAGHWGFDVIGADPTVRLTNSVFYDFVNGTRICAGVRVEATGTPVVTIHNCTAHNCRSGFFTNANQAQAINCIAQDCTLLGFNGTFATGTDFNASDDSTGPGANSVVGEVTFANEGADDFHLADADTVARSNGTDLSGATYPITTDIDGQTRSAWDIGADEFGYLQVVGMDAVQVNGLARQLVVVPGAVTIAVNRAMVNGLARSLAVVPGDVTIAMDAALVEAIVRALAIDMGGITIGMDQAIVNALVRQLAVVPGDVVIGMDAAVIGASPNDTSLIPGAVAIVLDAVLANLNAEQLTVVPGGVVLNLDAVQIGAAAGQLTIDTTAPLDVTVEMDVISIGVLVRALRVLGGRITLPDGRTVTVLGENRILVAGARPTEIAFLEENRIVVAGADPGLVSTRDEDRVTQVGD